jgi:hypothetical protein
VLGEPVRVLRRGVEGIGSDLLVGPRGDAEPWWHREPRTDQLTKIRRLAPHDRQQLRTEAAEIEDEFLIDGTRSLGCGHTQR